VRTLAIDAELLVLLVVGTASRAYLSKHRRLRAYSEADFDLLKDVITSYAEIVVTPNTLTEASNLLGYVNEPIRSQVFAVFKAFIENVEETYLESKTVSAQEEFIRLGLTDAALLGTNERGSVLITSDLDLYLAAADKEYEVLNFNHLREAGGTV
jgi:hypothetical protein